MERIFADFTAQVFAFIRFDLPNQRHPRSISVKFGIAAIVAAARFCALLSRWYSLKERKSPAS
ncbi:MAG: hypothetical protein DWI57_00530 [Chloroflexi bacterium]|nr:MAG: hypothetical protein DWI57_00530 [Chloroflexota bacterium]